MIKAFLGVFLLLVLLSLTYFSDSLMFFWIAVFLTSLFLLLKSSDYFTDAAEKIGISLGIPAFIVGVTIVSVGTSLPELASSFVSVFKGASEFVVGNVVGSNVANILLVVGIAAIFARKLKVSWDLINVDLPLLMASAIVLVFICLDGQITMIEAILALLGYGIYLAYTTSFHKKDKDNKREKFKFTYILILILSSVGIYFGAEYTIQSVIRLSEMFSFGDTSVLALSAVALGTSLPELMVSVQAARKGNHEMALGNVLGSNIFNSFVVTGLPALFGTLVVPGNIITIGLGFMGAATLFYIVSVMDKEITMYEGAMFFLIYVLFIGKLFGLI